MFFSTARTAASRAAIARRTYATKQAGESFPEECEQSILYFFLSRLNRQTLTL